MKVLSKQNGSKTCLICGKQNPLGLKADFYNLEDGSVGAKFTFKKQHRSYPGRVHGGMITALLDELAGRTIWVKDPKILGVTMNLEVKFRKPVPYDIELTGVGKMVEMRSRLFVAEAKIFDKDKNVLAECKGTYMLLPEDKIVGDSGMEDEEYILYPDDVNELDI